MRDYHVISYTSEGSDYWSLTEINQAMKVEYAQLTPIGGDKFNLLSNELSVIIDFSEPGKTLVYPRK